MIGEPWYGSPLAALMGNTRVPRGGADAFNEGEMDRQAAAANLHSWQVELQFYGSERTTLANWEYAKELVARKVPGARFTDGESLKVPLTRGADREDDRARIRPTCAATSRRACPGSASGT